LIDAYDLTKASPQEVIRLLALIADAPAEERPSVAPVHRIVEHRDA
jgi:hypothetical protein